MHYSNIPKYVSENGIMPGSVFNKEYTAYVQIMRWTEGKIRAMQRLLWLLY